MTEALGLTRLPAMEQALIRYYNQVLGIRDVLMPVEAQVSAPLENQEHARNVMVLFVDDRPWVLPAAELFQKMCAAMKLAPEQVQVLFLDQISKSDLQLKALSASAVVSFSQESLGELPSDNQFQTVSPTLLIENPSLKKEVWVELQKVMKTLELS